METAGRRATAALWCLEGWGPVTLARLEAAVGDLGELLERPVPDWSRLVPLSGLAQASLGRVAMLASVADALEHSLRALGQRAIFPGDAAWPGPLERSVAPILFLSGPGARGMARRVAIVGTRHPEPGVCDRVQRLAAEVAGSGVVVVSGAAEGVDRSAHLGALSASGETWAFLGSAIEQMDPAQHVLWQPFHRGAGSFFSQFPPGTRANRTTFRRRNPLISGAADAVLIVRAPRRSGALITAEAAQRQGRPLLALPGDPWNAAAQGSNALLLEGRARVCLSAADLLSAAGFRGRGASPSLSKPPGEAVSPGAAQVMAALEHQAADVDELMGRCAMGSGPLSACLVELELAGYVVQRAGGRFERIR